MKPKGKDIIFGRHPVLEALQENQPVEKVWALAGMRNEYIMTLRQICKQLQIPLQYLPKFKLDKLTKYNTHQGVAAMMSLVKYQRLEDVLPFVYEQGYNPLFCVLDGVTDTRNLGAIARSAEVFGVHAMVTGMKNAAAITADAVKTSAGAIHRISICREPLLTEAVQLLQTNGLQVIATTLEKDAIPIQDLNFKRPTAIVLGAEDKGMRTSLLEMADVRCTIPQIGTSDSLNVSVAGGVIFYEAMRQRMDGDKPVG